jgi:polyhydroxyalkanoate synthesis regulator protein
MDGIPQFLVAVAAVIGAIVLIGGALALVRGSYNKARIQALREDNEDLRNRVQDCEDKLTAADARETALEMKVQHVESENDLLTQLVTQRADVDKVLKLLDDHHKAAMSGQAKLTKAIEALAEKTEKKS